MSTHISHIPILNRAVIPDWQLFLAGVVYILPVGALLLWKPILGIAFALAPLAVLLICQRTALVYLLLASTFVFFHLNQNFAILPCDVFAIMLVAAYFVDLLLKGPLNRRNILATLYVIYLGIGLLSLLLEGATGISIRYFLRQILLFLTFCAVAHFGPRINLRSVAAVFVIVALANSAFSLTDFVRAGGTIRAFGFAGLGFADHTMVGLLICAVFYICSSDLRARIFWGVGFLVLVAALAATQTRASAITAGWALLLTFIMAFKANKNIKLSIPKRGLIVAVFLLVVVVPVVVFSTPIFDGIVHRFERMGFQVSGTVLLRVILWKLGFAAFKEHPIFGIGPGQYAVIINYVPAARFEPMWAWIKGMGPHVSFMTALTETGVVGLIGIVALFGKAVQGAHSRIKDAVNRDDLAVRLFLFIFAAVVFGSSMYAGAWFWGNNSYHMAVFFGFIATYFGKSAVGLEGAGK